MIPPGCHSNGYSVIHKAAIEGGTLGGECVCPVDVSGVATNNHPGGAANGRNAPGWRPWKQEDGRGVKQSEVYACFGGKVPEGENDMGMVVWMNGQGENGTPVLEFDGTGKPAEPPYERRPEYVSRLTGRTLEGDSVDYRWGKKWNAATGKYEYSGDHIFYFFPQCDRLMFAQNAVYTSSGVVNTNAEIEWWRPTLINSPASLPTFPNADVRPFRAPASSIAAWGGGAPFQAPATAPACGDWRFNPKIADYYMDDLDIQDEDPTVACGKKLSMALVHKCMQGSLIAPGDVNPDWLLWNGAWGGAVDDLIMLYGMADVRKNAEETPAWRPIYWTQDNSASQVVGAPPATDPALRWGRPLESMLRGTDVYGRDPGDDKAKFLLTTGEDVLAIVGGGNAFDLRIYCQRWNWKAVPLKQENGRLAIDREQDPEFGYFNTKCWISVRQIAPVPPR